MARKLTELVVPMTTVIEKKAWVKFEVDGVKDPAARNIYVSKSALEKLGGEHDMGVEVIIRPIKED